jgi:hypothetical protein
MYTKLYTRNGFARSEAPDIEEFVTASLIQRPNGAFSFNTVSAAERNASALTPTPSRLEARNCGRIETVAVGLAERIVLAALSDCARVDDETKLRYGD